MIAPLANIAVAASDHDKRGILNPPHSLSRIATYNAKKANGDGRWLQKIELVARGLEDFGTYDHQIMKDLKLPDWAQPNKLSWPPPPPPIDYASISAIRPHPGAYWWQQQQAEQARRREEIEKYEEELRQEEGRKRNAPAAEADARQREEVRRRNNPAA